jgi:hypothetical protein
MAFRGCCMRRMAWSLIGLTGMLCGAPAGATEDKYQHEISGTREEVYIFRTSRTQRVRGATPACKDAGFESAAEDRYTLASLMTASGSSKVARSHVKEVGEFLACFGTPAAGKPIAMYAVGKVAGKDWIGRGECHGMSTQPPDKRVVAFNCNLAISGLSAGYAGGWMTSSTLQPSLGKEAPPDAQVTGYLSTSIVVMRLWKTPTE